MGDIICTVPWTCGFDDECPVGWHLTHYWMNDDGSYSSCDEDGNHEPCSEADLPDSEEYDRAWREYAAYVAETGLDPLGEFSVKRTVRVRERWDAVIAPIIGGVIARKIRHAGRLYTNADDLPDHARLWFNINPGDHRMRLRDFDGAGLGMPELQRVCPDVRPGCWTTFYIERDKPRSSAAVARELRAAARKRKGSRP